MPAHPAAQVDGRELDPPAARVVDVGDPRERQERSRRQLAARPGSAVAAAVEREHVGLRRVAHEPLGVGDLERQRRHERPGAVAHAGLEAAAEQLALGGRRGNRASDAAAACRASPPLDAANSTIATSTAAATAPRTTCSRRAPTHRPYRDPVASRHDEGGDPRRRRRRPERRARARRARLRRRRSTRRARSPAARRAACRCPARAPTAAPICPPSTASASFPGFYRHLPDTMRRIPVAGQPDGVAGNLVASTRVLLAQARRPQRAHRAGACAASRSRTSRR